MKRLGLAQIAIVMLALRAGYGAFLESDFPEGSPPPPAPPVLIPRPLPPIPPPRNEDEVSALISNLIIGQPYHHQGMTVFPLSLRRDLDWRSYLTLDHGVRSGQVEIYETGIVGQVRISNRSEQPLFILAGEVLIGGKQNRMIQEDVVVPARTEVTIGAYCVEKGRWEGDVPRLQSSSSLTAPGLRYRAAEKASQDALWSEIEETAGKLSVRSPTQDFQSLYESKEVREKMAGYQECFRPIWQQRVVGVVVCRFGSIVGAEIFGSSGLFEQLHHKILDSYVLDRLQYSRPWRCPEVDTGSVRRFLDQIYRARIVYGSTPGEGRSVSISGPVNGSGLVSRGAIVHLSLFEGVSVLRKQ